jgi:hypothetical protein
VDGGGGGDRDGSRADVERCASSGDSMMKKDDGMMKKDDSMMKNDDKMMDKK